jgi:hypothetical protein
VSDLVEQRLQRLKLGASPSSCALPPPPRSPATPPSAVRHERDTMLTPPSRGGEQPVAALRRAMAAELSQLTAAVLEEKARTSYVEEALGKMQAAFNEALARRVSSLQVPPPHPVRCVGLGKPPPRKLTQGSSEIGS